jgi:Acetyltransferase (isoleucine patch superfamily)
MTISKKGLQLAYQLQNRLNENALRNFHSYGKNTVLDRNVRLQNEKYFTIGNNCYIGEDSFLYAWDRWPYGKEGDQLLHPCLVLGDNVVATRHLTIYCTGNIIIGNNVLIASDVLITDENHGTDPTEESYLQQPLTTKDIKIGNGAWIGEKCSILPGATIGDKAIIGANSVVTKEIPPCTIAVGNPARVIKEWDSVRNIWIKIS